jgi:hypothetical protein
LEQSIRCHENISGFSKATKRYMSKPNEIKPPMMYSGVISSLHQSLAKGQQSETSSKENQAQANHE